MRIELKCKCGSSAIFDSGSNYYQEAVLQESKKWQEKHDSCIQNKLERVKDNDTTN